jgi:sulfatase modifying factor 1
MKLISTLFLLVTFVLACSQLQADTFGSGTNAFEIEFVTIGQPGNPADTTGDPNPAGSVPYEYRIGKYEIPEDAVRKANAQSALDGAPLGLTLDSRGPNKPATSLSWFEAATFVNWLNTSTEATPAYKFDAGGNFQLWAPGDSGYDPNNLFRNTQARYFLPTDNEWYKAAFYDPSINDYWNFPTASDSAPTPVAFGSGSGTAVYAQSFAQGPADVMLSGGPSPYGTVAQAGNVAEWEETEVDLVNDDPQAVRGYRDFYWAGGAFDLSSSVRGFIQLPANSVATIGFRVSSIVPEPDAILLALLGINIATLRLRRSRIGRIAAAL